MRKITDRSTNDLMEYRVNLEQDFNLAKRELLFRAKHFENIKKEYNKVLEELKKRHGIK